jgi:predicted RNA binding protein YcfA (HicA-like mRNA interferase family)
MTRLPRLTGAEVIERLVSAGFSVVRVRGSHHRVGNPDGRSTPVPVHGSEIIGPGLLSKILRDCELTREEFEGLA